MSKKSPTTNGTFRLRLTPRQYPVMRDLVIYNHFIGVESLEKFDNGPIRSLYQRKLIATVGGDKPHLAATQDGVHAVELYHRGKIFRRKSPGDITDYVRLMLRLKNGASR